ncbi:11253_t:CDS:2 [Funneliformis mosseae]|uniref:11253_t:CDS:1 n=1 Tax=Funneliformis mosseae TaxID=27381 RepID=A0A9N9E8F4_FUNMO|nr:11253_t:CDS:2 [Funneliformis mosseae]
MAELISADLKSNHTVLTDLIDDWLGIRIGDIGESRIGSRIRNTEMDQVSGTSTSEVKEPLPKKQKIKQMFSTANVSSEIAPIKDFLDTMTKEEIFRYKANRVLIQFFSQLSFNP